MRDRRAIGFLARCCVAAFCVLAFCAVALAAPGSLVPPGERISDAEARLELARLLSASESGRAEALDSVQTQLRQSPEDAAARLALAELLARSGRVAEAEEALRALPAKTLALAETQERIGDAWFAAGRMPEAARHLKQALDGGRPVLRKLAQALTWSGETKQARPLLEKLAAEHPGDQEIALLLVRLRLADGDASGAAALARTLAQAASDNPKALAELADVEAALGHAAQARALYERALALPQGSGLLPRYAQTMQLWGAFGRAIAIHASSRAGQGRGPAASGPGLCRRPARGRSRGSSARDDARRRCAASPAGSGAAQAGAARPACGPGGLQPLLRRTRPRAILKSRPKKPWPWQRWRTKGSATRNAGSTFLPRSLPVPNRSCARGCLRRRAGRARRRLCWPRRAA